MFASSIFTKLKCAFARLQLIFFCLEKLSIIANMIQSGYARND